MTVRGSASSDLRSDVAAGAGAVVDHDLLFPCVRHALAKHSGKRVGGAPGRKGHDEADRLLRVLLGDRCVTRAQKADGVQQHGGKNLQHDSIPGFGSACGAAIIAPNLEMSRSRLQSRSIMDTRASYSLELLRRTPSKPTRKPTLLF